MTVSTPDFIGSKAALFCGIGVLAFQRDDRPDLRWAGHWDLPGGGREGRESPEACLLRELEEEFGLQLSPERLLWRREFPSIVDPAQASVFFGGRLLPNEVASVRFGDEGQGWSLMPLAAFLSHDRVVPEMQRRAAIVWDAIGPG